MQSHIKLPIAAQNPNLTLAPLARLAAEDEPVRRLACAILLSAITDARQPSTPTGAEARQWIASPEAETLARAVGLEQWPPSDNQIELASKQELFKRINWQPFVDWRDPYKYKRHRAI